VPGFDGTGPMGMGPMTGGGRGFCAIPLSSGQPAYTGMPFYGPYAPPYYRIPPFALRTTREQEFELLKNEYQALGERLKELETRIEQLSTEKG
jgi:hypothetical protein